MKNTTVTEAHYALRREVIFSAPDEGAQLIASSEAKAVGPHAHVAAQLAAVLTECGAPEFANSEHALQWAKGIAQLRAELERLKESLHLADGTANLALAHRDAAEARAERAEAQLHALRLVCGTTDADKFSTWVDRANARAERAEASLKKLQSEWDMAERAVNNVLSLLPSRKTDSWEDAVNGWLRETASLRNRAERAEADADSTRERALTLANSLDEAQAELADEAIALRDMMSERDAAEAALTKERARLDWLMAGGVCMVQHSGGFYVSRLHAQVSRAAIDSAMKEETK